MAEPGLSPPQDPLRRGLRALSRTLLRAPGIHLALGAALIVGAGTTAWSLVRPAPDVGLIEPVHAAPAETVETVTLDRGRTLGDVLESGTALDANGRDAFLRALREEADPRRMRAGIRIGLRRATATGLLRGIDLELNPDETVRLSRDADGWTARTVLTPVRTDTLFLSGAIESVLWTSVVSHPELTGMPAADRAQILHRLDQIFQWQVDFSRQIRDGDTYRFVLEREVRPDGSMRSGRIVAAELENQGTAYHAIWFDPNGDGDGTYYDREGRSVRRFFLKKPLEFRRISSRFTSGRYHPILERWRAHRGVDYAADRGTPIMATGDGVIVHRGRKGGLGNAVIVRHPNGFTTRYGHMSGFARGLSVGSRVRQGRVIGAVGATGLATGPHLHYEMIRSGRHVDPLAIELPPGDPVPRDERRRWEAVLAEGAALLERVSDPGGVRTASREMEPPSRAEDEGE